MSGEDHDEIDRPAGDAGIEVDPDITPMAVQTRQFLGRAVHYLTPRPTRICCASRTPCWTRLRRIQAFVDSLEVVEPGFAPITQWRSGGTEVRESRLISAYGAVARTP
ncbi:hypothetical protein [Nocardia sp. R7R-8]|uniref:hypothetical protein n=1 Tax=Nocardia sp. R7R-8 TaxID=3459304 RepID=UPI00403D7AF9